MLRRALLASVATVAFIGPALAQSPQAPTVAAGSIAVTRQGATTVVTQSTQRGVIDWRSFSIGPNESVRFDQPGASSVTLNRVTGSDASRIDGRMSANGQVWLANPNGVLVGPAGQVNVGGLLATTGRVDPDVLMKTGQAKISGTTGAPINVEGLLKTGAGGAALIGRDVSVGRNALVEAVGGSVNLGAGSGGSVGYSGERIVNFEVDKATAEKIVAHGSIRGEGVRISAATTGGAGGSVTLDGSIVSTAGGSIGVRINGDKVQAAGSISAPSQRVELAGNSVTVSGSLDVSGEKAGSIAVGGGWQGAPMAAGPNSQKTVVTQTASLKADGAEKGGLISVWSDGKTSVAGSLSATGAQGGRIETSGKRDLAVAPTTKVTTAGVKPGTWLLDPNAINVTSGGTDVLTGGALVATGGGGVTTLDPALINAATGNVTLQATNSITISSPVSMSFAGAGLILQGSTVSIAANVATNNGDLVVRNTAGSGAATGFSKSAGVTLALGTGALDVQAGTITLGSGSTSAGNVLLAASGNIVNSGTVLSATPAGTISIVSSGGNVTNNSGATLQAGASGTISIGGVIANLYGTETTGSSGSMSITGSAAVNTIGTISAANLTVNAPSGLTISGPTTVQVANVGLFNGTIDSPSPQSLTFIGGGAVSLSGDVGATNALASFASSNPISFGGSIINAGTVALAGVALSADTTVTASGGSIAGNFNGAVNLKLSSSSATNAISYSGNSGSSTPLASITMVSAAPFANAANLNGTLSASGAVSLDPGARAIVLTGNSAVTSTSGALVFGGTIDGPFGLVLASPTAPTVGGNAGTISGIGGATPLASFGVISNGTVAFSGNTTAGAIDIAAPVALNGQNLTATSGTLALGSSTQLIMISGSVGLAGQALNARGPVQLGSGANLSVNSYGLAHFGTISTPAGGMVSLTSSNAGAVDAGGFSGTGTLSIVGSGRTINTVGVFSGAVNGFDVNTISLQSGLTTISQAAGASAVSLGPIGGVGALSYTNSGTGALTLASVSASVAGVSIVNGGTISLPSTLSVGGTSSITGTSLQVAAGGISLASGGRLDLNGPLNASNAADTLSIVGGAGVVALNGAVGGSTPFASLTASGGTLGLGGAVTAATIAINSPLLLTGNTTLSAAVSTLTPAPTMISGTVDGAFSLAITGKPVSITGVVGGATPLASLDLSGAAGPVTIGGSVSTTGGQSYNGMLLLGSAALNSGAGAITTGAVDSKDGGQGLSISTGTGAVNLGSLGGGTPLASLSISSGQAGPLAIGQVASNGAVSINSGSVALSGSTISAGGAVTLGQTVSLAGSNSVSANGAVNLGNVQGPGDLSIGGTVSTVGINSATGVGTLGLQAGGALAPTGSVQAATISNLATQTISIGANSATIAQTGASPMTLGTVISSGGSIAASSGGNLTISSSIANLAGVDFKAAGSLSIASGVTIAPTGALSIAGSSISNAGSLSAGGAVTIAADNTISVGSIGGTGALTVKTLTAGRGISVGSSVANTLYLADLSLGNGRSSMTVGGASAGTVSFGGLISRSGNLDVVSGSAISVSAPLSVLGGTLSYSAPSIMASASISDSGGVATMTGTSISLAGGSFAGGLNVNASTISLGAGTYSGSISATGGTTLAGNFSSPVSVAGSAAVSSGSLSTIAVTGGNLSLNGGTLTGPVNVSGGGLALNGGTISTTALNASGGITAKGNVTLNSPLTASVTQTGALTLAGAGSANLVLTQAGYGLIAPNLMIAAGSKLNGSMSISGGLTINGAQLVAAETITAGSVSINGAVTGPGALSITTSGAGMVSGSGSIAGLDSLNVSTGTLGLANAAFTAGTLSASGAITGSYSAGSGGLSVSTPNLSGTITSAGPVMMSVTQVSENITAPSLSIGPFAGQGPRGTLTGSIAGSADQSAIVITPGAGSSLTFNGVVVTGSKPTIATKVSVASVASMPSIATVASTPTVAAVVVAAPVVPVVVTQSAALAAIAPVLPQILALLAKSILPGAVLQVDPLAPVISGSAVDGAGRTPTPIAADPVTGQVPAAAVRDAMQGTPSGALIPVGPAVVGETGAPLIQTPTIKVDPNDAGGVGGQVVALGQGRSATIIPGLVTREDDDKRKRSKEPPLSEQPSEINDEMLF